MSYQSVSEALGKWVNKPLAKLPRDLQPIATAYIPQWQTLTPKQRTDRAIEVDRQRGLKSKLRYDRATRSQQAARDPAREAVGWYDATLEADHWAALGNPGWGYDDVLPWFLKSEDNDSGADAFHATGGPLHVQDLTSPNPLNKAFVDALASPELKSRLATLMAEPSPTTPDQFAAQFHDRNRIAHFHEIGAGGAGIVQQVGAAVQVQPHGLWMSCIESGQLRSVQVSCCHRLRAIGRGEVLDQRPGSGPVDTSRPAALHAGRDGPNWRR